MIEQITHSWAVASGFVQQHLPGGVLPRSDLLLGSMLVIGVLASTLGAKLARPIVTLAFGGLGATLAGMYGHGLDFPLPVTIIIAAALAGMVGYLAFRLWVGVGAGGLLALIALSIYGSTHIIPHLQTFEASQPATMDEYVIPDVPQEQQDPWKNVAATAKDFWAHLQTQQADIERDTLLIAAAAGLFGLVVGVWAVRFTLVVSTAIAGTSLLVAALSLVLQCYWPQVWESLPEHSSEVNIAVLGFLLASLILQTLLTRRPAHAEPAPAE